MLVSVILATNELEDDHSVMRYVIQIFLVILGLGFLFWPDWPSDLAAIGGGRRIAAQSIN